MNLLLLSHELLVLALGLGLLLVDLWLPLPAKRKLGYVAAAGVGLILLYSLLLRRTPGRPARAVCFRPDVRARRPGAVLQALLPASRPHCPAHVGRVRRPHRQPASRSSMR